MTDSDKPEKHPRVGPTAMGRLRNYLLTGLLVLAPSAVTLWVF